MTPLNRLSHPSNTPTRYTHARTSARLRLYATRLSEDSGPFRPC